MKLRLFISSVAVVTATSLVPVSAQMAPNLGALTGALGGLTGALGAVPVVGGMAPGGGGMSPMLPGLPGMGGNGSLPELPGLNGLNSSDLPLLANDQPVGQVAIAANQQNRRTDLPRLSALPIPEGTFPIASPSVPSVPGTGEPGGTPTVPGLDGLGNLGDLGSLAMLIPMGPGAGEPGMGTPMIPGLDGLGGLGDLAMLIPTEPNSPPIPGFDVLGNLLFTSPLNQELVQRVAFVVAGGPDQVLLELNSIQVILADAVQNFDPSGFNIPSAEELAIDPNDVIGGDLSGTLGPVRAIDLF